MSKIKFPSIEVPTTDVRSLQNTVQQLKEAVEIMSGVRGASPFLTSDDLLLLQQRLTALEKAQGWETIFDAPVTNVAEWKQLNLGGYRRLKLSYAIQMVSGSASTAIQFSNTNGASWNQAALDYNNMLIFHDETTPTVANGASGAGGTITGWRTVVAGNPLGESRHEMIIDNWNMAGWHKKWNGTIINYDGALVLHGMATGRSGSSATLAAMNAIRLFASAGVTFTGWFTLQGYKP